MIFIGHFSMTSYQFFIIEYYWLLMSKSKKAHTNFGTMNICQWLISTRFGNNENDYYNELKLEGTCKFLVK